MTTNQAFVEQAQAARDLRVQLSELGNDQAEVLFEERSPERKLVKLWRMSDGEEITLPQYQAAAALSKRERLPDGTRRFMFTAYKDDAPVFVDGQLTCFLAATSKERREGLLEAAGIGYIQPCATKLRTRLSQRRHAERTHPQSWAILQEYLREQREETNTRRSEDQLNAMMALVQNAGAKMPGRRQVDVLSIQHCECGWATPATSKSPDSSMRTHKRLHCPLRETAVIQEA